MTSEIRANIIKNRVGLGTIEYSNTGPIISGVTTALNFKTGTSNLHNTGLNVQDLDVDGHANLDNVSIAGVTTFSDDVAIKNSNPLILSNAANSASCQVLCDGGARLNLKSYNQTMATFENGQSTVFYTNSGQSRLIISNSGNVAISKDLDVDGHTNLDNVSIAGVTTFSTSPVVPNGGFYKGVINSGSQEKIVGGYTSGTDTLRLGESMYLLMTGRLGLNTNNPQRRVHIHTTGSGSDYIQFTNDTTGTTSTSGYVFGISGDEDVIHNNFESTNMRFYTAGAERLRIDSSGHLKHTGIRSGNSENKLAILSAPSYNTSEEDVIIYQAENEVSSNQLSIGGGTSSRNAVTAISLRTASAVNTTGGTERIRIHSNGNITIPDGGKLGVNGAVPQTPIDVIANSSGYAINVRGRSSDNVGELRFTSNNYGSLYSVIQTGATYLNIQVGSTTNALRIDSSGNIGAGIAPSSGARLWIATNDNPFVGTRYNAGADGSVLFLQHSRSNTIGTNVALNNNDEVGTVQFRAYASNNSSVKVAASIKAQVNGTTGTGGVPTDLIFATGTNSSNATEKLRIATDGVITAQKSGVFGNTSDSFTALTITSSTSGISELRFADTTANAGYVKYEHSNNNLILATNATPRMTIQSTGIVKVETSDSSGLNAHILVNNSESNSGVSLIGSGSSFSSGGWAAVTDAGIIRSSANSSNGLVLQAASGNLRFYAGGNPPAERLRITSDGFVGISESDPYAGLTVGRLGDYPTGDGNTYYVPEGKWSTSWNSTNAIVDNTDYWVGYTGGYLKNGCSVNISLAPNRGNTNNQSGMYISGEATGIVSADFTVGKIIGGSATGRGTSGNVRATKSELFRITSSGQLLSGGETSAFDSNTAVQFRKDVSGNQARFIFRNRANNGNSRVQLQLSTLNRAANADTFSGIEKYQSGGMSIYNGENSNQYSNINFLTNGWRSLQLRNGNHSGAWCAEIDAYWGTSNGLRMEVGGPQSGTWQAIDFHTSHTGTQRGYIGVTYGGVSYNTSSDYRMKQDVVDLTGAIDRVKSFKPRRFRWKEDLTYTVDGFLAHEAQTVVPESVQGEKDGEQMQVMDNSKLVPVLTAALKEAIAKIETLETKVAALEG